MVRGPVYEDNYKVYLAAPEGVDDISAPTLAEITAATYLGRTILKTGVALGVNQNRVDVVSIDELFNAQRMGSWGATPALTMWRDDEDESDGWDLIENGTLGFLIITPFGEAEAGDPAFVLPVEMGVPRPADSAADTGQSFMVDFAVTSTPDFNAVVASS